MMAYTYRHKLQIYFIAQILCTVWLTATVCGESDKYSEDEVVNENNVLAWYILDVSQILQNSKVNTILSPMNLLKTPAIVDLRFGADNEMEGINMILAESRRSLSRPENVEMFYNTKIQEISFADTANHLVMINDWGKRVTNEEFPKLIESNSSLKNLQVLILNMFHFVETLEINFKYTANLLFYITPKQRTKVPAVETTEYLKYLDSQMLDAKILQLPYSNGFSMYILLPHTKAGLNELLSILGFEQLKRLQWMMEVRRVNVLMPTFKYSFITNLKEDILDKSDHRFDSDFENSFSKEKDFLNIFKVAAISFNGTGKPRVEDYQNIRSAKYEKFHVDRPFVYYIENKYGEIVCIGKVENPEQ
uniref:Serpin H1 n=1 Tax=Ceratitis capitata TaxID=7213 RepID=W8BRM5_CERCA